MIKLYEKIAASGLLEGGSGIAWVNLVHKVCFKKTVTLLLLYTVANV